MWQRTLAHMGEKQLDNLGEGEEFFSTYSINSHQDTLISCHMRLYHGGNPLVYSSGGFNIAY